MLISILSQHQSFEIIESLDPEGFLPITILQNSLQMGGEHGWQGVESAQHGRYFVRQVIPKELLQARKDDDRNARHRRALS